MSKSELEEKKKEWIETLLNNEPTLPELDNTVTWNNVEYIQKVTTKPTSILKKNQHIKLAKQEDEEIDPDIMMEKQNGGWGL